MNGLIRHWPVAAIAAVWIGSVLSFRTMGAHGSDALGMGLLFFYILMPFVALVASVWYGYMFKKWMKWLMVIALGLLEVFAITICAGDWDFGYYWSMSLWTAVPAAIGMLIGSLVGKRRNKPRNE